MNTLKKYALITGATSGIGLELAKLFANDKYNLVIVARDENELSTTANSITTQYGVDVRTYAKDLSLPESSFELFDEIRQANIDIDVLVNNAGQGLYGEFADTDLRRELSIIQLNITSLVVLTKYYLQDMIGRGGGKILNLSSVASKAPGPLQSVYHGTKAFVQSFSEAVRNEVKDKNITITALLPGATDTDFFNKAGMLDAKNVAEGKLADAAAVAKDGYNALMRGDDMVVSGFKNKMKVAMSNIIPDSTAADMVHKEQEPVTKSGK